MYFMLIALCLIFFVFIVLFTVLRIEYVDKTGREYNASIFIAVPLSVVNMILTVILAYQSWNVETLYVDNTGTVNTYISQLPYMTYVFYVFFLIHIAIICWNVFEFFIESFYEPKGKMSR
jgi:hypothetical protein